jgi:hypothetical protein
MGDIPDVTLFIAVFSYETNEEQRNAIRCVCVSLISTTNVGFHGLKIVLAMWHTSSFLEHLLKFGI